MMALGWILTWIVTSWYRWGLRVGGVFWEIPALGLSMTARRILTYRYQNFHWSMLVKGVWMRRFSSRKNLLGMERWRLIVISRSKTIRGRVSLKELGRIIKSYPFDASCRSRRLVLGRKGRLVLAREIRLEMQVKGCLDIRVKDCLIAFLRR